MRPNLHYFIYVTMESLQSWYTSASWYIGTHGLFPRTRVQMDMSEILSHCRLHKPVTLVEDGSTYTVAEYLGVLMLQ